MKGHPLAARDRVKESKHVVERSSSLTGATEGKKAEAQWKKCQSATGGAGEGGGPQGVGNKVRKRKTALKPILRPQDGIGLDVNKQSLV